MLAAQQASVGSQNKMMKSAHDRDMDYKSLVRNGYDKCAQEYAVSRQEQVNPEILTLVKKLPPNPVILDIGCGSGIPLCRELVKYGSVTGIDISSRMISLARMNVPSGNFSCGDIMEMEFPSNSFDAITAFYTIFHIPKEEHEELFRRVHLWLKPKGFLMTTLATDDEAPYTEDDFFGVTMYWSNYGISQYKEMLVKLGFSILDNTTLGHGFKSGVTEVQEEHPLLLFRKVD